MKNMESENNELEKITKKKRTKRFGRLENSTGIETKCINKEAR